MRHAASHVHAHVHAYSYAHAHAHLQLAYNPRALARVHNVIT